MICIYKYTINYEKMIQKNKSMKFELLIVPFFSLEILGAIQRFRKKLFKKLTYCVMLATLLYTILKKYYYLSLIYRILYY